MTLAAEPNLWTTYQHATGAERERIESELLEEHKGLAHHVRLKFHTKRIDPDDLQQIAMIGLLHAIRKFNPNRGHQFSTFAVPTIFNKVNQAIRYETAQKRRINAETLSLDVPVGDDTKRKNDLIEIIEDPEKPLDAFVTDRNLVMDIIRESRSILTTVEYRAFWMRYGKDEPEFYEDIAKTIGLSVNGTRLAIERASFKLRRHYDPDFHSMHYHKWKKDEIEIVKQMVLAGATHQQMFARFPNRTNESVRGCIRRTRKKMEKEGLL